MVDADIEALSYKEIQKLCKKRGVSAKGCAVCPEQHPFWLRRWLLRVP
jgi:hypothetical protein